MAQKQKPATQIMLGSSTMPVRASYPHVFAPHAMQEGQPPKYSCAFLIDKNDKTTLAAIERAVKAAVEKGKTGKWGGKVPKTLKMPLHDGDAEREGEEYQGMFFLNASSKDRPEIVDRQVNRITDTEDFYAGCYCRATVNFYPFDTAGNRGIGCGLMNIQKIRDGENLTGRTHAQDDFDDLGEEISDDDLELGDII